MIHTLFSGLANLYILAAFIVLANVLLRTSGTVVDTTYGSVHPAIANWAAVSHNFGAGFDFEVQVED